MATSLNVPLAALDARRTPGTVWRLSPRIAVVGLSLLALMLWLFMDGLATMWQAWDSPEYSHALLIPPVALFLIWQKKDRLEQLAFSGSWWGPVIVLLGVTLLLLGQFGTIYTLVQYAYVITLIGMVLALTGMAAFRSLFVPLFILFFMIPLPEFLFANLSTKLQLVSSQLGVDFMRVFGVSVFLEGNVIDLGGYKLQVAEACSGLRYLFPLMTLGFLMAYFYKGAMWKRSLLFLSSIPLTVLMNSFRVGIIGVTVDRWGIGMAEGFLHEFQGWVLFMVCAALMLAEIALLNRIGTESGGWRQLFGVELPVPTPKDAVVRTRSMPASFIAAGGVLVSLLFATMIVTRPTETHPARATFAQFPTHLGSWHGHNQALEQVYLDQLKLDDYELADYVTGSAPPVNFYVSYYNSQRKGEAVHSPRACLPGGGWQMRDFAQRPVPGITVGGRPLRVNRALIELGNQRELVYYWFQQRGRIITNEFVVKWYLFWDAVTRHRTDGAMVRLITPLPVGANDIEADRRLVDFAAQIAPHISQFIPD